MEEETKQEVVAITNPDFIYVEEEDESEAIPEDAESEKIPEYVSQNPFGFPFSPNVTKCFTDKSVPEQLSNICSSSSASIQEPEQNYKIVFFSGNAYEGESCEGIIHGQGKYTWTKLGASYTGTFNWGSLTGTGKLEWADGSVYEGEVLNGIRHGQGTYTRAGDKPFFFEGGWEQGKFHGQGTCYYGEKGCTHRYVGEFLHGIREGHGTMYYPNGNVYEGEWRNGVRHGHGKFTWADSGSYYVGEFANGQLNGEGEIVYAFSAQAPSVQFVQSNRYLGHFENSERSGDGTFYYANGAVYKGEWKNNKKDGTGTFTSRDGRVYNSEFRDGSIYQDGQYFVPTPSISLSFSLDGLLAPSESADEVMNSLCNIYVRFLPKLRALYQSYARIQWADDKTITALRMVGMWRFLQDKGTILDADFSLCDADSIIHWNLESPSAKINCKPDKSGKNGKTGKHAENCESNCESGSENSDDSENSDVTSQNSEIARSTLSLGIGSRMEQVELDSFANKPLANAPDPFATLFLYQLFESLVRLAHHRLSASFPDSLILQVTRFLENSIFVDDAAVSNPWAAFRKRISTPSFDDTITRHSPHLLELYLDYSGFAEGCSRLQIRQLAAGMALDPNIDATIEEYHGLMTTRDLVLFLGDRGFFGGGLTVMEVLLFLRYGGIAREVGEEEEGTFRRFFTNYMHAQITFVEFVQSLAWIAEKLIVFDWDLEMKFEYVIEHIDTWCPPEPQPGDGNEAENRGEGNGDAPPDEAPESSPVQ